MKDRLSRPVVLTIAGSDSGGGAGLQADLETFHAVSVFGCVAVTAVTAQSTRGVASIHPVPPTEIARQIDAVLSDIGADAIKSGMLGGADAVHAVADRLRAHAVRRYVLDPVMVAKGGARLLEPEAEVALRDDLLPLASLVTPNADEIEVLTGLAPRNRTELEAAGRALLDLGAGAALLKGGHLEIEPGVALDLLVTVDGAEELRAPRLTDAPLHGGGCTLSAAIAAHLAHGLSLREAVRAGKRFLHAALERGGVPGRGHGHGCPDRSGGLMAD